MRPGSRSARAASTLLLGVGLVLLVAAVFAQTRTFEFLRFDDQTYVSQNPNVLSGVTARSLGWAFTTGRAANWHPLTWIAHMVDVEIFGTWPGGHHLTSVAVHAVATLLLFRLLLGLVSAPWTAAALTALWAVHPLRAESVAWIAERKDVLSGALFLAVVVVWIESGTAKRSRRAYLAALGLCALGLLAKPMLVSIPPILLLLDRWPLRLAIDRKRIVETLPFAALAAASSIVTLWAQRSGGAVASTAQVPAALRIENAIVAIPTYLARIVWPSGLGAFYPFDPALASFKVALAAVVVTAITGAAIAARRAAPFLSVGWGWFAISLVPVIGLVQIGFQATADRYTYVPSIGLVLLLAGAIGRWEVERPKRARAAFALCAAAVIPLAFAAHRQTATWHDGVSVFQRAIAVGGENYVALRHLAEALEDAGRDDEAIAIRVRVLEARALAGERDREAMKLIDRGKIDPARRILEAEVRDHPNDAVVLCHLGTALAMENRIDEAAARFDAAARVAPELAMARYNLALAREAQGRDDEALSLYDTALRLEPQNVDALFNSARVLARRGRAADAKARLEQLVRIRPDYPGAAARLAELQRSATPR